MLLDGDNVNAPARGFTDGNLKEAFLEGALVGPASFPPGPASADGFDLITAPQGFSILRNPSGSGPPATVTLRVTDVAIGTDNFRTDRGSRPFPAWKFWMQGVLDPASVLAISPGGVFTPPPSTGRPQAIGAGSIARDARTLRLTFSGPPAGNGPCEANFVASSAESRAAVAIGLRTITSPTYGEVACALVAYERHLTIRLRAPLGHRVVVDASSETAVPVTTTGT